MSAVPSIQQLAVRSAAVTKVSAMITFEVNGRKVSPNQISDALMAAALESIKAQLEDKIKKKLTAVERQKVRVTVKGRDIKNLSVYAEGPDEIIAKLKDILDLQ